MLFNDLITLNNTNYTITKPFTYGNNTINVKQYLTAQDKLALIQQIINESVDDKGYYTDLQVDANLVVYTFMAYTDVEFNGEEVADIYDYLMSSGIFATMLTNDIIPASEYGTITTNVRATIRNIYAYRNSALGIMEATTKNLQLDEETIARIQQGVSDPKTLSFLKEVLGKLG